MAASLSPSFPGGVSVTQSGSCLPEASEDLTGLFHLAHPGEPESWWSVATKVVQIAHEEELLEECPEVRAEGMAQAERLKVRRPVHTAMDPVRLRSDLRWRGVSWEEEARLTLSSLRRNRRMRLPDGESR